MQHTQIELLLLNMTSISAHRTSYSETWLQDIYVVLRFASRSKVRSHRYLCLRTFEQKLKKTCNQDLAEKHKSLLMKNELVWESVWKTPPPRRILLFVFQHLHDSAAVEQCLLSGMACHPCVLHKIQEARREGIGFWSVGGVCGVSKQ